MNRCLELAGKGAGRVAPNPLVGAVLVHENRIIGEGYHEKYGLAHAEVNCLNSVRDADRTLISDSTLYVSLEPCAHFGKTPPCADFIITHRIKRVVVGAIDIFARVAGKGIEKMRSHGIEVITGVMEEECRQINRRFFTFHRLKRPYVVLKWAQNAQNLMGVHSTDRLFISNQLSNRLVHKWRHEEAAILVGKNTALFDNPSLTVRYWPGQHPVRILLDRNLEVPESSALYNGEAPLLVFNCCKEEEPTFVRLPDENFLQAALHKLYERDIQSVLVEGGAAILKSFISANLWDEARVIESDLTHRGSFLDVVRAPVLENAALLRKQSILNDTVTYYKNNQNDYLLSGK